MSKAAIGQALDLLQELPDSDQQVVLQFLKNLKSRAAQNHHQPGSQPSNSALKNVDGFLVFVGEISNPGQDWLKIVREERDRDISATTVE